MAEPMKEQHQPTGAITAENVAVPSDIWEYILQRACPVSRKASSRVSLDFRRAMFNGVRRLAVQTSQLQKWTKNKHSRTRITLSRLHSLTVKDDYTANTTFIVGDLLCHVMNKCSLHYMDVSNLALDHQSTQQLLFGLGIHVPQLEQLALPSLPSNGLPLSFDSLQHLTKLTFGTQFQRQHTDSVHWVLKQQTYHSHTEGTLSAVQLQQLAKLPKLQSLCVTNSQATISHPWLQALAGLTALKELAVAPRCQLLCSYPTQIDFSPLQRVSSLTTLALSLHLHFSPQEQDVVRARCTTLNGFMLNLPTETLSHLSLMAQLCEVAVAAEQAGAAAQLEAAAAGMVVVPVPPEADNAPAGAAEAMDTNQPACSVEEFMSCPGLVFPVLQQLCLPDAYMNMDGFNAIAQACPALRNLAVGSLDEISNAETAPWTAVVQTASCECLHSLQLLQGIVKLQQQTWDSMLARMPHLRQVLMPC